MHRVRAFAILSLLGLTSCNLQHDYTYDEDTEYSRRYVNTWSAYYYRDYVYDYHDRPYDRRHRRDYRYRPAYRGHDMNDNAPYYPVAPSAKAPAPSYTVPATPAPYPLGRPPYVAPPTPQVPPAQPGFRGLGRRLYEPPSNNSPGVRG